MTFLQTKDVDNSCNIMMKTLTGLIKKYTKTVKCTQRRSSLPWLNNDICQLMKKRDLALKNSLFTKSITDLLIFKGLRNRVVRELRLAKTTYFTQLIVFLFGNTLTVLLNLSPANKN